MSSLYYCGCQLSGESAGQHTTADEKIEPVDIRREQLYYNPDGSPFYPRTHAEVVLVGTTGNSVQDVLETTDKRLEKIESELEGLGKHHIVIADDLMTDSKVRALSARQGMKLKEQIAALQRNGFDTMDKVGVDPYLYRASYSQFKEDVATDFFTNVDKLDVTGCSAFAANGIIGHTYDAAYDNQVSFLVSTPGDVDTYATIGLAGNIPALTSTFVANALANKHYSPLFDVIPFSLLNGFNEAGLSCAVNVVKADKGLTVKTIPAIDKRGEIQSPMLIRYILDNFASAQEACEYIRDYMEVHIPKAYQKEGKEQHFLIADKEKSYVLEFVNGAVVLTEHAIATNFYITGVNFLTEEGREGEVYTPYDVSGTTQHKPTEIGLTAYGTGLERYNAIVQALKEGVLDIPAAKELIKQLYFTHVYDEAQDPVWYTEFTGINDCTVDTPAGSSLWLEIRRAAIEAYNNRERDGITKQTACAVIYDLHNKQAIVYSQEGQESSIELAFKYPTISELNALEEKLLALQDRVGVAENSITLLNEQYADLDARVTALENQTH